jgi:predicted transposase/invertase (TIGR01784 family)
MNRKSSRKRNQHPGKIRLNQRPDEPQLHQRPGEPHVLKAAQTQEDFIMLPVVDYCFKELMEVENVRKGFIAAVLHVDPEQIKSVELLPTILKKQYPEEKYGILDVRTVLDDDTQIDMEMQVAMFDYWAERTVFYVSKMYVDQIKTGQSYGELKKCINISILDFELFPNTKEFVSYFQLREKNRGSLYTDKIEFHIIELPKLSREVYPEDALLHWAKFFHSKNREEFKEMAAKDKYINEAYQTLERLSMDKEKRREYEAREKAIRDYNHQMYHAEKRGLEEGIKLGLEQGMKQGLEQGLEQGMKQVDRTNQLTLLLLKENRLDDLVRAASDPALQEALFKEFGL